MNGDRYTQHISLIYEAASGNDSSWANLMGELCKDLGFKSAVMALDRLDHQDTYYRLTNDYDSLADEAVRSYYYTLDCWTQKLVTLPTGQFYDSENQLLNVDPKRVEFFNFCKEHDIRFASGIVLRSDREKFCRMAFQRSFQQKSFTEEMDYLNALAPHLVRALKLKSKLDQLNSAVQESSALFRTANGNANLVNRNAEVVAGTLLDDPTSMQVQSLPYFQGRFWPQSIISSEFKKLLNEAIDSAERGSKHHSSSRMTVSDESSSTTHTIEIQPWFQVKGKGITSFKEPLALITVHSQEPAALPAVLKQTYGLTDRECKIAYMAIKGLSSSEIAQASHRSINTVKSQLKSLYAKTNSRNRANLVTTLLDVGL